MGSDQREGSEPWGIRGAKPTDTVRGTREELIQHLREAGETDAAMRLLAEDWTHGIEVNGTVFVVTSATEAPMVDGPSTTT